MTEVQLDLWSYTPEPVENPLPPLPSPPFPSPPKARAPVYFWYQAKANYYLRMMNVLAQRGGDPVAGHEMKRLFKLRQEVLSKLEGWK